MLHRRHLPLVIFVGVQFLCFIAAGIFLPDPDENLFLYGMFYSQNFLLGIWGGLSANKWFIRLVGVTLGIVGLILIFHFCFEGGTIDEYLLVCILVSTTTIVMRNIRGWLARLELTTESSRSENVEGLQFSIRHLMVLTLFVGCILTVGRWIQPYFSAGSSGTILIAVELCFLTVGVISVWATLGNGYVLLRSLIVLMISLFAAVALVYAVEGAVKNVIFCTLVGVMAIFTLASLYVVRRSGYRMVRISSGTLDVTSSDVTQV